MDIDLPDLTNRPRGDLRPPTTYRGLPFSNPIDSAIPSEPAGITEEDVKQADEEGDYEEEVEIPDDTEEMTSAAAVPDFEERAAEDDGETNAESSKKSRRKKKGARKLKIRI